ncbi:MAG: aldo/keto reductase [Cyanobacteria bacterium CRU_2_1]|nr:aldo/keto reductase [Cyanobacteria bacterium RU_5_0]NJR58497.1 aldo/keto reductase [Cyanobacteria bacterium CRU_2_1]
MSLSETSRLQFAPDLSICRMLNGMWQVSGTHGTIDPRKAIPAMFEYVDAGFTTWDLADHYGPAEDFIGEFRRQFAAAKGEAALSKIQALTKWVPRPGRMTRSIVEEHIDISRRRMQTDCLDLLQFHWWEYRDKNYLDALNYMTELQLEGKIRHLALTNFDTEHLQIIVDSGIKIVSNQVQYSLVDRRPEVAMVKFCRDHNIKLFTYGTLCGGLFSKNYLDQAEPGRWDLGTASLRKYKQMVDAWGGWSLFQQLLKTLNSIAQKHQVTIPNVAVRYILDRPAVGGVIVGTRLGVSQHIQDNASVFSFTLDPDDHAQIEAILSQSHDLFKRIGDCGDEYRR